MDVDRNTDKTLPLDKRTVYTGSQIETLINDDISDKRR